jgi:type IV secretory pathway VirB4 component
VNVFLTTKDDIIIVDPEGEYFPLVKRLNGQVINLSPNSKHYINPMDISKGYGDDGDPIAVKSDFILSMCEQLLGHEGLRPIERSIIDRAVRLIYQPYIANPYPENVPVLQDLYEVLLKQNDQNADYIAQSLEMYVTGSLNIFNNRTNVDVSNRLLCFDIRELGNSLKPLGMLILQDQVWARVSENRQSEKFTWFYCDEFHLLLRDEQTAKYCVEFWKRFRKWRGIPTAMTQNVKDFLASPQVESILDNSDFALLLNQAGSDRQILAERLNISPHQLSYITQSGAGAGLIKYGGTIIPFVDRFPRDTELYRIMSTRAEVVNN